MRRREFITLFSGVAAVWPLVARAQERALPVIGYLSFTSPDERPTLLTAFLQGLEQAGYLVGRDVKVEYRSAGGHYERLPALAAELVKLPVAVIAATGGEVSARAAKGATSQIPIVFTTGSDPVSAGLVAAINRPGGNVTGVNLLGYDLDAKRLQLLHELLPHVSTIGVLVLASNPAIPQALKDMQAAADVIGRHLVILNAATDAELDSAFASLLPQGIGALLITTSPFFEGSRDRLVALAERYRMPVFYPWREYVTVGGLISYGTSFTESYRQAGLYVGRILKGESPADLPVVQATKFELLVNLKTAKTLGLTVPNTLSCRRRRGDRVTTSIKRREFISRLGGAAAMTSLSWPLAARAQQPGKLPMVGFIRDGSADASARLVAAFRKGLNETGTIEGQNVTVEYHWLEGHYDRLPALLADLIRRPVAVIAAPGNTVALTAKAATATIPIVFGVGEDPVQLGLVTSLARPGGNATGINFFAQEVTAKRLRLLHDLVPKAVRVAVLVNPANASIAEATLRDVQEAAPAIGLQIQILNAATIGEIDAAFASLAREHPDALLVAGDGFFTSRAVQFATLTARDRIPAAYAVRELVAAGGLMSYGTDLADMFHQVGVYTGQIVKGAKPADLPVLQSTKFEFLINLQTARALGIEVPSALLLIADEVIE